MFDEIYLRILWGEPWSWSYYRRSGDANQLPSIEPFTNCQTVEEYVDSCIDAILEQNIFFKIRNRVRDNDTGEGETNSVRTTYDDWWIEKLDGEEWILKHFKMTRDVMQSENNIAYSVPIWYVKQ